MGTSKASSQANKSRRSSGRSAPKGREHPQHAVYRIVGDIAMTGVTVELSRWLAPLLTASVLLAACDGPPVVRQGPTEQRVMARTNTASAQTVRADLLD